MWECLKNLKLILFLAAALLTPACTKHHDDRPDQEPALDQFRHSSIAPISWEKHCDGIEGFFVDFQKIYLPDVAVSFGQSSIDGASCLVSVTSLDTQLYDLTVSFSKGGPAMALFEKTPEQQT